MPNASPRLSRRRMITMLAAAAAAPSVPGAVGGEAPRRWVWRGTALGAPAMLILEHPDRRAAEAAIAACLAEIERLEGEFSLHRRDSALSRLNEEGALAQPSLDMLTLLETASTVSAASAGAFDIIVQPLWRLYAEHFVASPQTLNGPSDAAIVWARQRVNYRRLSLSPALIELPAGMSVTMNGIAQGYITDRVADLLRARGWAHVIDLGEIRALGHRADGGPWTVAIDRPAMLREPLPVLSICDRAVATSSAAGTIFEPTGRYHHLFDPRTGCSASGCAQVNSSPSGRRLPMPFRALFVAKVEEREAILRRFPGTECLMVETDGRVTRLTS